MRTVAERTYSVESWTEGVADGYEHAARILDRHGHHDLADQMRFTIAAWRYDQEKQLEAERQDTPA